jgi:hypothetical protein
VVEGRKRARWLNLFCANTFPLVKGSGIRSRESGGDRVWVRGEPLARPNTFEPVTT